MAVFFGCLAFSFADAFVVAVFGFFLVDAFLMGLAGDESESDDKLGGEAAPFCITFCFCGAVGAFLDFVFPLPALFFLVNFIGDESLPDGEGESDD